MNGKGFLKGIQLSHCLDTIAEWHALVHGLCEVMCPWPPRHKVMDEELADEIRTEHHYYLAGRVLGLIAFSLFGLLVLHIVVRIFTR